MCVVSMVGDHYAEKWPRTFPDVFPKWPPETPRVSESVTRKEFDALRRDVEEMKALLIRAKEYDKRNNEPDCEIEDKMTLLRRVAEAVGIDLDDVLEKKEAA